jgi:hypothetical protein
LLVQQIVLKVCGGFQDPTPPFCNIFFKVPLVKRRERGGWIKFDKDMTEEPRLMQAAVLLTGRYSVSEGERPLSAGDQLRFACNAVTGGLVTLWRYADVHIRDDDTLPMTRGAVDAMVGIDGFCALMPREWMDELEDGTVILPGYCQKNSLIAKKKAAIKSNARVAAFRAKKKINGNGVTHALLLGKNTVTVVVDQDQDLYQDKEKDTREEEETPPFRNGHVTALQNGHAKPQAWDDFPSPDLTPPPRLPSISEALRRKQFEAIKHDYPLPSGRVDWIGAEKFASKLVADGIATWEQLYAAVIAYKLYVQATGSFVMNPVKFFNAVDRPWSMTWEIPEARGRPAKKPHTRAKSPEELDAEEADHAKH